MSKTRSRIGGESVPAAFERSEQETLQKFREVRDLIEARILDWLANETLAD